MTADTHLKTRTWTGRSVAGDAYYAFEQIVDYCCTNKLDALIVAGDCLDATSPSPDAVVFLASQLQKLKRAKCRFLYVLGNHDRTEPPWHSISPWAEHLTHGQVLEVGTLKITGMDFAPAGPWQELASKLPAADILVLHQTLHDFMGDLAPCQGSLSDIGVGSPVTLIGDYHVRVNKTYQDMRGKQHTAYSPGSTHRCSIVEPDEKFFLVVNSGLTVAKKPLLGRPIMRVPQVCTEHSLDRLIEMLPVKLAEIEISAELPENLRQPLVYIPYTYNVDGAAARLEEAIGDKAELMLKVVGAQDTPDEQGQVQISVPISIESVIEKNCEPKVAAIVRRLLVTDNPAAELIQIRHELLNSK